MNLYSATPQTLASFFEVVEAGVIVFDVHNQVDVTPICTNSVYRSMYGGHGLSEELTRVFDEHARACSRQLAPADFEHALAYGKQWLRVRMIPVFPEDDTHTVRIFATIVDITAKRRLEEDLQVANVNRHQFSRCAAKLRD